MTTVYPMIHGWGIQGIYAAMLRKLPVESARAFWRSHPLRLGGAAVPENELYHHIWSGRCRVPADYFASVLDAVEPFVNSLGLSLADFGESLEWKAGWGGTLRNGEALEWFQPHFREFFGSDDPMQAGIEAIRGFCRTCFPGCGVWRPRSEATGSWKEAWLAFAPDRGFRYPLRYEMPYFTRVFLGSLPRMLGLPAVDEVGIQADCREAPEVLRHAGWRMDGGELLVQGERFGRVARFSGFCRKMGFDFGGDTIPDGDIVLAEKDFFCPLRKRVVLFKGCAYGAPCYIASWRYRLDYARPSNPFAHLAIGLSGGRSPEWSDVEAKHRRMLAESSTKAVWVYHRQAEILEVDGRKLFKGAQARILRKVLKAHLEAGETRFAFRRFRYDREVVEDPKRSNLELHMKRISEKLEGSGRGLRLEFPEKGQVSLRLAENALELLES